jgi:hypothetical protein
MCTGGLFVLDGPQHSHPIPLIECIFGINQWETPLIRPPSTPKGELNGMYIKCIQIVYPYLQIFAPNFLLLLHNIGYVLL